MPGPNSLKPVGFGTGEPNLEPLVWFAKQTVANATLVVPANLVMNVAAQYFFSNRAPSFASAGFLGLTASISNAVGKIAYSLLSKKEFDFIPYASLLVREGPVAITTFALSLLFNFKSSGSLFSVSSAIFLGIDLFMMHNIVEEVHV